MAADWIPCELSLFGKREVLAVARETRRSRFEVAGLLLAFWGWFSTESADGAIAGVSTTQLRSIIGGDDKFWRAVVQTGWLTETETGIAIPNADRWVSRGAKARLQKNRRQATWRDGDVDVDQSTDETADPSTDSPTTGTVQYKKKEQSTILSLSFGRFWAVYPKHVAKSVAQRAWQKLNPSTELVDGILNVLGQQKESRQWQEGFVPNPATWINQRRWEDEPMAAAPYRRAGSAQLPDRDGFVF